MSDEPVSPVRHEESATTREEMDFDENEQEAEPVSPIAHEPTSKPSASPARKSVSFQDSDEAPPTKPPRPLSPQQQAEHTLIEAFPSIDTKVVRAVLMASGGKVEPAFNALLGMSDPDFKPEQAAPPQPPRPAQRAPQNQLEADEMYARQLAEQYGGGRSDGQNRYNQREPARRGPNQQRQWYNEGDSDQDRNFFDDDLPEIGRNIQQGFLDTQKKFNGWLSNFKKRIDGDGDGSDDEDLYSGSSAAARPSNRFAGRQNFGPSQSEQLRGIQRQAESQRRQSTEASRYDADPHELDAGEFERLELRDDEAPPPQPPRTSSRKSANPDLFKPQPRPPQSGPVDEVDAFERKSSDDKSKKWQPLTSIAPHPEDDNDPFSVGDEDDEKDKTTDLRKEDSARLKEAARTSISGPSGADAPKSLQENERSGSTGTKNKEAEELLTGKKS